MSARTVRCPACSAIVSAGRGQDGRYWCTACDEVFEVHELPEEPPAARPYRRPEARSQPGSSRWLVVVAVACGVLGLIGMTVMAYVAFQKDAPKEKEVVAVEPPKPKAEPAKAPAPEPVKKAEPPPKKEDPPAPKPPTHEEIVRRVKGATVYIRTPTGSGTGFFAGAPGFVVTNAHVVGYGPRVVQRPAKIEVVVASGEADEKTMLATVFGADVEADLALLRVEGGVGGLPAPLAFGKAAHLTETQEVVIYGYPFGELLGKNISINKSTVSSLRKEGGKLVLVQLAGGLNPGNSGGPVTNVKGEVIGVSVAKLRGAETIAFAIPAEEADSFVRDQERTGGRFDHGSALVVAPPPPRPPIRPPVRPPVNPPPEAIPPLVLPPVQPVPITPAEVGVTGTEVKLPAEADQVCVGGGGRFLVANLPKVKQIAVFDLSAAKVVRYLPAGAEKALLAAGMDKLLVVYPGTNVVQRWSLTTFEKEVTGTITPTAGLTVTDAVMGSASNGPLFVQALDFPRLGERFLFDITTMKEVPGTLSHNSNQGVWPGDTVRCSADGRVVTVTRREGGSCFLALKGAGWIEYGAPWRTAGQPALPSADGQTVYGPGEMATPTGKRIGNPAPRGRGMWYLPALHGPFVLTVIQQQEDAARSVRMAVHSPRDTRPMFYLPRFEATDSLFDPNRGWAIEGHVFFAPQAKVVAVLPRSKDRIVLYKVDVDEELKKTDLDYLFVASHPPAVVPGKRYEYAIDAKAKKGGLTYKLDFGPNGLAVGADGKVTWDAPADFDKPVSVAVTVSDKSGQEIIHTFELIPAGK